jgi:hypothetical protein
MALKLSMMEDKEETLPPKPVVKDKSGGLTPGGTTGSTSAAKRKRSSSEVSSDASTPGRITSSSSTKGDKSSKMDPIKENSSTSLKSNSSRKISSETTKVEKDKDKELERVPSKEKISGKDNRQKEKAKEKDNKGKDKSKGGNVTPVVPRSDSKTSAGRNKLGSSMTAVNNLKTETPSKSKERETKKDKTKEKEETISTNKRRRGSSLHDVGSLNGDQCIEDIGIKSSSKLNTGKSLSTSNIETSKITSDLKIEVNSKSTKGTSNDENDSASPKAKKKKEDISSPTTDKAVTTSSILRSPDNQMEDGDLDSSTPRYQSKRAAAEVAKSRISNKGATPNANQEDTAFDRPTTTTTKPVTKSTTKTKSIGSPTPSGLLVPTERQWAACDTCGKWRQLPFFVDPDTLPEQWFCRMNRWDSKHNQCHHDEESGTEPISDEMLQHESNELARRTSKLNKSKPGRKPSSTIDSDGEDDGYRRRSPRAPITDINSSVVAVDWVQCNRCQKWRKCPGDIAANLPGSWYCIMNTWNPVTARCSVKEESEDSPFNPILPPGGSKVKPMVRKSSLSSTCNATNTSDSADAAVPVKKVTQWVQCERRNCKKWRKVPGHIDMESLPEKWYCEMNTWDLDRATCDYHEDTDSDQEAKQATTTSQLITANTKGPGSLSYRRIIFGADGRLRPVYSEKARNGYGMFSFTETNKSADNDEYIEPTRRIGYWWSDAYDESGVKYFTMSRREAPNNKKNNNKDIEQKDKSNDSKEGTNIEKIFPQQSNEVHHLLNCARRMARWTAPPPVTKKGFCEIALHNMTLPQRQALEMRIIRSCLVASSTPTMTLSAIIASIKNTYFMENNLEAVRVTMTNKEVRMAIRRLEIDSEAEVTYSQKGEVQVSGLQYDIDTVDPLHGEVWSTKPGLPLKMRKHNHLH